ncbi:MAG: NUDIX domain-containing protein [Lachnospiraceae bacterium]|nr:NUDIX domain-containing protein [Lachnospiraceae bacterium]
MVQAQFYYRDVNAPKPNRPNHIGTCILIEYREKILLEHRADSDTWALIGGGLKLDERLVEGVIRETLEETGIRLQEKDVEFCGIYDDPSRIASYPDGNVLRMITVVYRVRLTEAPNLICSTESRELRFFTREELHGLNVAATHIPIVEDYLQKNYMEIE